jgi:hypothetical protein
VGTMTLQITDRLMQTREKISWKYWMPTASIKLAKGIRTVSQLYCLSKRQNVIAHKTSQVVSTQAKALVFCFLHPR